MIYAAEAYYINCCRIDYEMTLRPDHVHNTHTHTQSVLYSTFRQ